MFSVCQLSVLDTVDLVEERPEPDCIIFIAVPFVRLVNEIAESLSEYTFLYRFDILATKLPLGCTKYFTPLK